MAWYVLLRKTTVPAIICVIEWWFKVESCCSPSINFQIWACRCWNEASNLLCHPLRSLLVLGSSFLTFRLLFHIAWRNLGAKRLSRTYPCSYFQNNPITCCWLHAWLLRTSKGFWIISAIGTKTNAFIILMLVWNSSSFI